jgi:hypothetical protein
VVSCGEEVDGFVLFNPDTDDMAIINPSGRALWDWLATPRSAQEMAAFLVETYEEVSQEQAAKDVQDFITSLLGDYLLEVQAGDGH